jgi:hypothetical protein
MTTTAVVRRDGTPRPRRLNVDRMRRRVTRRPYSPAGFLAAMERAMDGAVRAAAARVAEDAKRLANDPTRWTTDPTHPVVCNSPGHIRGPHYPGPHGCLDAKRMAAGGVISGPSVPVMVPAWQVRHRITAADLDRIVPNPFRRDRWGDGRHSTAELDRVAKLRAHPARHGSPLGWVSGPYPMDDPGTPVPIVVAERPWVETHQRLFGITVDGVLGPQTWDAIASYNDGWAAADERMCGR